MNPEVTVSLFIESSELSLEQISKDIGISCDDGREKGWRNERTGKVWPVTRWRLIHRAVSPSSDVVQYRDTIAKAVQDVLTRIRPYRQGYRRMAAQSVAAGVFITTESPYTPPLEFEASTLAGIAELGVGLFIDVVLAGAEDQGVNG